MARAVVRRAEEPPRGLRYVPDFVSPEESAEVLQRLARLPFRAVVMRGVTARRTVVHYGLEYGYDAWELTPGPELPAFLHYLRQRVAALMQEPVAALAQVLVTHYPPGATIGWHRDAPMFGTTVVGVSLGAPATLRLRRPAAGAWLHFHQLLATRSAYVLAGAARWTWQHSIAAGPAPRYSITFRTLRAEATRRRRA